MVRRKKTRKLGKWQTGFGGVLTGKYKAKRKTKRRISKKSRRINRARSKKK